MEIQPSRRAAITLYAELERNRKKPSRTLYDDAADPRKDIPWSQVPEELKEKVRKQRDKRI